MPSTATHGRAVSSAASARPGETVTITVTPDQGWQTAAVTVKDQNGAPVPVRDNGGVWSFTMPNSRVSVSYSFTESKDAPGVMGCPRDRTCPISRFTDASPDQWYHDGVHWALTKGVMNGVGGGLGSCERDLKKLCTGATFGKGLAVAGHACANSASQVAAWAKSQV